MSKKLKGEQKQINNLFHGSQKTSKQISELTGLPTSVIAKKIVTKSRWEKDGR